MDEAVSPHSPAPAANLLRRLRHALDGREGELVQKGFSIRAHSWVEVNAAVNTGSVYRYFLPINQLTAFHSFQVH